MANKPEAPVDYLTDYPLPFVPDPNLPPLPERGDWDYDRLVANYHHPVFRHWQIERFGIGGKAARDSRIQWSWRDQHDEFHENWGGLQAHLPNTELKQYRMTLFGVMQYIPEQGISFTGAAGPHVERFTDTERELLREQIIIGNDGERVRRFLLDYPIRNGGAGVDPELVERFLRLTRLPNPRPDYLLEIGNRLLNQALDPVVTPNMREVYAYTRNNRMLRPGVPRALGSFIKREIMAGYRTPQAFIADLADKFNAISFARV